VPAGPARSVALEVTLPVYVVGNWAIGSFTGALRVELEKYRIAIVPEPRPATARVRVDLGELTYRRWQTIDVSFVVDGQATPAGSIRVTDLGTSTLEAAAEPVAVVIARRVWAVGPSAP
jgi:hypothetical protein